MVYVDGSSLEGLLFIASMCLDHVHINKLCAVQEVFS